MQEYPAKRTHSCRLKKLYDEILAANPSLNRSKRALLKILKRNFLAFIPQENCQVFVLNQDYRYAGRMCIPAVGGRKVTEYPHG
jgi:hypothetical protein